MPNAFSTALQKIGNSLQKIEDFQTQLTVLPFRFLEQSNSSRQNKKKTKYGYEDRSLPRPKARERRLTLSLDDLTSGSSPSIQLTDDGKLPPTRVVRVEKVQRTVEQDVCTILKLPAEIRSLIWEFVVCGGEGGRVGVVWDERGVLKSYLVSGADGTSRLAMENIAKDKEHIGRTRKDGLGVMGILCSCRALYTEIILHLYQTPLFTFPHLSTNPLTLLAFLSSILPHRRNQIRHLDLTGIWVLPNAQTNLAFTSTSTHNRPPVQINSTPHRPQRLPPVLPRQTQANADVDMDTSYDLLRTMTMRSELPSGIEFVGDWRQGKNKAGVKWAIERVLSDMEGLRLGGVQGWE